MRESSQVILQADGLTASLGGRVIVRNIALQIGAGEWLGVLGPNGSGKTTLLRACAGLIPHGGRLDLDGRPLGEWSSRERARRIAFVRQQLGLSFDFSVLELVLLGRSPHRTWLAGFGAEDRRRAMQALAAVDLDGFDRRSMMALSGGEQRRVLLAQALVQDTPLLLLDEPTTHLDVNHRYGFLDHVRSLADRGRAVMGVFHDLELAARYADRLVVLSDGEVVKTGTPKDVLRPELIADVFRMRARVDGTKEEGLRVHYERPLLPASRTGDRADA